MRAYVSGLITAIRWTSPWCFGLFCWCCFVLQFFCFRFLFWFLFLSHDRRFHRDQWTKRMMIPMMYPFQTALAVLQHKPSLLYGDNISLTSTTRKACIRLCILGYRLGLHYVRIQRFCYGHRTVVRVSGVRPCTKIYCGANSPGPATQAVVKADPSTSCVPWTNYKDNRKILRKQEQCN